jgi:photosystem II stability/assembly factor-like uncharacterized protein
VLNRLLGCAFLALGGHLAVSAHTARATWTLDGLRGVRVHAIAVQAGRPGSIYAAADEGIYVRPASSGWRRVLQTDGSWAIHVSPDGHTVIAGDADGEFDASTDGSVHWRQHFLSLRGVFAVTAEPDNPDALVAGTGDGVFSSDDGGTHWTRRLVLHGQTVTALAWQGASRRILYAGTVAAVAGVETTVYRSTDSGKHWHTYAEKFPNRGGIMALSAPGPVVLAGTMGNAIWRTTHSARWQQIARGIPPNQHVAAITVLPGREHTIYIGTLADGVFQSRDGGRHWTAIAAGLPNVNGYRSVSALTYDTHSHSLLAATPSGVYSLPLPAGT